MRLGVERERRSVQHALKSQKSEFEVTDKIDADGGPTVALPASYLTPCTTRCWS